MIKEIIPGPQKRRRPYPRLQVPGAQAACLRGSGGGGDRDLLRRDLKRHCRHHGLPRGPRGGNKRDETGWNFGKAHFRAPRREVILPCGESGSTLRFLLPAAGALGARARFKMEGRLPERPLAPLDRELMAHGMSLEKRGDTLACSGKLRPGTTACRAMCPPSISRAC